ncbi:MAG: RagB/SusD family nutrient uptake outer membrane protein [Bacteroidales bacterium]|nr:RagB/SusD family nutrient uptake outer membrane protein [Bacteroidales bacterium]
MNSISFKYHTVVAVFAAVLFSSCNDLELAPTNKFTEANYWTSPDKATYVLNMAYSQMSSAGVLFNNEALSDNLYGTRGQSNEKIISSGQANADNGRFASEWSDCYAGLKTCHTFLDNVDGVPDMDETLKARMKAEARFIRAFLFFRLTTWFGDVPLFTTDITLSQSKTIARTPQADVLSFILAELEDVANILPSKQEYANADRGRITKGAAVAMKARVYLYQNDWANVSAECEKLINSENYGKYELFNSYAGLFLPENEYNSEVILDYQYVPVYKTWGEYFDYAPITAGARVNALAPAQELADAYLMLDGKTISESGTSYDEDNPYDNRDPRLTATIVYDGYQWTDNSGTRTIYIKPGSAPAGQNQDEYVGPGQNSSGTGYYMRKYFDPSYTGSFASGLNIILFRYADILLMYAEAKNELGQMTETIWNNTIKPIRQRAGFTATNALNYPDGNSAALQDVIRRERRCELAVEGTRIFDLRRWKTIETTHNGYPHGAKFGDISIDNGYIRLDARKFDPERDYLWAVPQAQKDLNPNLGQNPKY